MEINKENKEVLENEINDAPKIVKTDEGSKDGQTKCPKCGSTDINLNVNKGNLRCNFCRHEFEPEKLESLEKDISKLKGHIMGSGATDIIADTKDVLTFKCSSCGSEVVIDTSEVTQARCHWCRNTLSVNQQIPNGSIPDVVLPFKVNKETAKTEIEKFVGKRKFYAHPKFRAEFNTNNIMGVYFSYMLIDINASAKFSGEGETLKRTYFKGSGDTRKTYYDADLYQVKRDFDLTIDGLSIEASSDKLNKAKDKTNNVINAIMPFDVEECVKWNANYLKGYSSEKRDTNVEQLRGIVDNQAKDIARFSANKSLKEYDRGVAWNSEEFNIKGEQWKSSYLPVWLYSYQQVQGNKKMLHYVAVNARTKETMGSVPIHMPKLIAISVVVEIFGVLGMVFIEFDQNWMFLFTGFIYFLIIYFKYRNSGARHSHETETKTNIMNLKKTDKFLETKKGLTNASMSGANNTRVTGQIQNNKISDTLSAPKLTKNILNTLAENPSVESVIKKALDKDNLE